MFFHNLFRVHTYIGLPWLWPVCGLWGKTLLWRCSDVQQHWQKINFNFFSCDTQLISQVTHQVWRGKINDMPACQQEILLDNVSSRYTRNVLLVLYVWGNTPGVGHYWNKDPPEVEPRGFLFRLCPCSMAVAQHKAHPKFKNKGDHFVKSHETPTILLYGKCM